MLNSIIILCRRKCVLLDNTYLEIMENYPIISLRFPFDQFKSILQVTTKLMVISMVSSQGNPVTLASLTAKSFWKVINIQAGYVDSLFRMDLADL